MRIKRFALPLISLLLLSSCTLTDNNKISTNNKDITSATATTNSLDTTTDITLTSNTTTSDLVTTTVDNITTSDLITTTKDDITTTNDYKNEYQLDSYINSLIDKTDSFIPSWNKEGFKGRWNYIDGVFLKSILDYADLNPNKEFYYDFVINYVNYFINSNGDFISYYLDTDGNYYSNSDGFKTGELDTICESNILYRLYDYTHDNRYLNAIIYTYNQLTNEELLPKTLNGINYSHKYSYKNQIWLDGMYMYVPFLLQYAKMFNIDDIYKQVYDQYIYIKEHMKDSNTGLYYHCHDTAYNTSSKIFWSDSNTGNSKSFWLRSMGWLLTSLADSIEYFPLIYQTDLKSMLEDALVSILKYKDDTTNMFYQVIDKGKTSYYISYSKYLKYLNSDYNSDTLISNYLESSGSLMIAYTLMKSERLNYISRDLYGIGEDIYMGVYNHSYDSNLNKLKDICITCGLGPENRLYRDGSVEYYLAEKVGSDDAKGTGPFVMAYTEFLK